MFLGPPGSFYETVKKTYYSGFVDLSIDVFLEVQNHRYGRLLYLIDYIAYGLHLWYNVSILKKMCCKPTSQQPGLGKSNRLRLPGWRQLRVWRAEVGRKSARRVLHRWNRNPRPRPHQFSKLVFLIELSQSWIFLNWLSGALVGLGGSDFIG